MCTQPAHGKLGIDQLGWPGIARREPVVNGCRDKALRCEASAHITKKALIAALPTTTVYEKNTGVYTRCVLGHTKIQALSWQRAVSNVCFYRRPVTSRRNIRASYWSTRNCMGRGRNRHLLCQAVAATCNQKEEKEKRKEQTNVVGDHPQTHGKRE